MSAVHFFAENSRQQFYLGLIWIGLAAAIAFSMPNALQITAVGKAGCRFGCPPIGPKAPGNRSFGGLLPQIPRLALGTSGAILSGMLLFSGGPRDKRGGRNRISLLPVLRRDVLDSDQTQEMAGNPQATGNDFS